MKNFKELVKDLFRMAGRFEGFTLLSVTDGQIATEDALMVVVEYTKNSALKKVIVPYSLMTDYLLVKAYIFDNTKN